MTTELEWERRVIEDPSLWGVRNCPVIRSTEAGKERGMIPAEGPPFLVVAGLVTRRYVDAAALQAAGWRLL